MKARRDYGYSRTVSYDSGNHLSVIFQCFGSVWRQVLPYCAFNVLLTAVLLVLLSNGIDLTVSEWGHDFMSVLVSFLVITKFNLTLSVYYEMQKNLMILGQATRQVVTLACCLSADPRNDRTAKSWRSEVAFYAMLLASTTATMLTKANDLNAWEAPGMSTSEVNRLHLSMENPSVLEETNYSMYRSEEGELHHSRRYEQGYNLPSDLNLRVPTRMAHRLQAVIASNRSLDSIEKRQLMDQVECFMKGFHGIRVYLTVPLPFSMVQMARIFLFLYIFTMPFAILSADLSLRDAEIMLLVFIMTFGFVGMELICMNMDDPFGGDPSDLPVIGETKELFEDVYLMVRETDGYEAAARLRERMQVTPNPDQHFDVSEKDTLLPR